MLSNIKERMDLRGKSDTNTNSAEHVMKKNILIRYDSDMKNNASKMEELEGKITGSVISINSSGKGSKYYPMNRHLSQLLSLSSPMETPTSRCKVSNWLNNCSSINFNMYQRPQLSVTSPSHNSEQHVTSPPESKKQNVFVREDFEKDSCKKSHHEEDNNKITDETDLDHHVIRCPSRQSIDFSNSDSKSPIPNIVPSNAPLSPESRKKNELCSYLQLMDLNRAEKKNGNVMKNRRSTRVKNIIIMSERKELARKLSIEAKAKEETPSQQSSEILSRKSFNELKMNINTNLSDIMDAVCIRENFRPVHVPRDVLIREDDFEHSVISLVKESRKHSRRRILERNRMQKHRPKFYKRKNMFNELKKIKSELRVSSITRILRSSDTMRLRNKIKLRSLHNPFNLLKRKYTKQNKPAEGGDVKEKVRRPPFRYKRIERTISLDHERSISPVISNARTILEKLVFPAKNFEDIEKKYYSSLDNIEKLPVVNNVETVEANIVEIAPVIDDISQIEAVDIVNPVAPYKPDVIELNRCNMFKDHNYTLGPVSGDNIVFDPISPIEPIICQVVLESPQISEENISMHLGDVSQFPKPELESDGERANTNGPDSPIDATTAHTMESLEEVTEHSVEVTEMQETIETITINEINIAIDTCIDKPLKDRLNGMNIIASDTEKTNVEALKHTILDEVEDTLKEKSATEESKTNTDIVKENKVSPIKIMTTPTSYKKKGLLSQYKSKKKLKLDKIFKLNEDTLDTELENRTPDNSITENNVVELKDDPRRHVDRVDVFINGSDNRILRNETVTCDIIPAEDTAKQPNTEEVVVENADDTNLVQSDAEVQMAKPTEIADTVVIELLPPLRKANMKSLHRTLVQNKRKQVKRCDLNDDECESTDWTLSSPRTNKAQKRSAHTINISESDGEIFGAYYFDYNLIVTQDLMVSFWTQSALGSILEAQNMWIPRGSIQRLSLDNGCVAKKNIESVISTESSFAYVELWTKEHKSDKRERPVADVFVVIYFWKSRQTGPEKKFLQLENINGFADDVKYVVLKSSGNILVSWRIVKDDMTTSVLRCYQLASDYQTITCVKQMESVEHTISSLHNIEDCDSLVVGCGEQKVTIWNLEHGYAVSTIDIADVTLEPTTLWVKCDRGFLFMLQNCPEGMFKLIAINGMNNSWKRLQVYKPALEFDGLQGVCLDNGILIAFYNNGILCWNVQSGDLIMEELCKDVNYLPSGKHVIVCSSESVQIKSALSFLITNYDFSET